MSQINRRKTSTPPPTSEFEIVTDDGTIISTGGSITLIGNSTTDPDDNGIKVIANPDGSDDGEVLLTNRLMGTATSTNGSTEDLVTFTLGNTAG